MGGPYVSRPSDPSSDGVDILGALGSDRRPRLKGAMLVPRRDARLLLDIFAYLDAFVARRVPGLEIPDPFRGPTLEQLAAIRAVLWGDRSHLDAFVAENPEELGKAELDVVRGFHGVVAGAFTVEREIAGQHTIFVHDDTDTVYGVRGLTERIIDIIGRSGIPLPTRVRTALVPFRGHIVWDGLPMVTRVTLGTNIRDGLARAFATAQNRGEIVVSFDPEPRKARPTNGQPTSRQSEYLAFIQAYTDVHRVPPSFTDLQEHFRVTPPTVNTMIKTLEARGFLARVPGAPRTLRVLLPRGDQPGEIRSVDEPLRVATLVIERLVPALADADPRHRDQALRAVLDAAVLACAHADQQERKRVADELQRTAAIAMNLGGLSHRLR